MASANNNTENNFKKIEGLGESQIPQPSPDIERNVMGTARSVGFIGNVIELYLSRAVGVLASLFGSKTPDEETKDDQDSEQGNFDNDNNIMPSGRAK